MQLNVKLALGFLEIKAKHKIQRLLPRLLLPSRRKHTSHHIKDTELCHGTELYENILIKLQFF